MFKQSDNIFEATVSSKTGSSTCLYQCTCSNISEAQRKRRNGVKRNKMRNKSDSIIRKKARMQKIREKEGFALDCQCVVPYSTGRSRRSTKKIVIDESAHDIGATQPDLDDSSVPDSQSTDEESKNYIHFSN